MNYNQNHKIAQITLKTLIIGIDIAKYHHVARAQDYRGIELGSTCFFDNTQEGFSYFIEWINQLKETNKMESVISGMEPTISSLIFYKI
ncbi:IS110 family transposase [Metabacillus niabensis]|uniref:IS110 family transposase n=1 Tax=Metabacillus niabensis TaxID=324854 RepID=UPI0039A130C2